MTRALLLAAGIAAWWLGLLAMFCDIPWRAPLRPTLLYSLPGSAFDEKLGRSHSLDEELSIDAAGPDRSALQTRTGERIDAARQPILHYRFGRLPRTLELSFLFRRADSPDDVQVVGLPWPVAGRGSFDLRRVPEWRGEIIEFGLSEFPTAQSVPPELGFRPFSLDVVTLESPSWQGALAIKRCDWFGYWPWALMSISALGPDATAPRGHSLVLMVTLGLAGSFALLAIGAGGARRWLRLGVVLAALAWLALDLRWLAGLAMRHAVTRELYAGKAWSERQALVPDSDVRAAALAVHQALDGIDRRTRVFVEANSDYNRARLVYHLQPLNTGPANITGYGSEEQRRGAYLVLYGTDAGPTYDASRRALVQADSSTLAAEPVLEQGHLRLYRFLDGGTP